MRNNNKQLGNSFERRLCLSLSAYGFWCHCMTQNQQGQPFDVIAARNGKTYPIDAKVCERDVFKLSRIEENQASAMTLWQQTGNGEGWFALEMSNAAVFFIPYSTLSSVTKATLSTAEIRKLGIPLGEWVSQCE